MRVRRSYAYDEMSVGRGFGIDMRLSGYVLSVHPANTLRAGLGVEGRLGDVYDLGCDRWWDIKVEER